MVFGWLDMCAGVRKKTICYFVGTHGDWGGASRIIFNIVRHIDRNHFELIVMVTAEGEVSKELEELGVRSVVWKHREHFGVLSHFKHLLRCLHFYLTNKVDIVVLSYSRLGWRPAELLAAKLTRVPVIQHCQQVVREPSPYTKYSKLILTCSNYVLEKSGFAAEQVRSIYDIVDVDRFRNGTDVRKDLGLADSHIVITFLGRKRKSKGLDVFVSLANELSGERFRFLVAIQRIPKPNSDSYSEQEFNALISADSRIRHIEFWPDIEDIYAASDIIVMPSQGEEPCPAVALEAAASGKPIVATDMGAISELVVHDKTGFLVQKGDHKSLVDRVRLLAADAELRAEMGSEAMMLAQERFFRQPIMQLHEIYETL
jgi:glycosyltransferase involved in cell wall biosynthesis